MKVNPWLAARKRAGKTLKDVEFHLRVSYPNNPELWVAFDKLQRFETGGSAAMTDTQRGAIAKFYGVSLKRIDKETAARLESFYEVVGSLLPCIAA